MENTKENKVLSKNTLTIIGTTTEHKVLSKNTLTIMENTTENKALEEIEKKTKKEEEEEQRKQKLQNENYFGIGCLCFATFTSILAFCLFGTAFATDHWKNISVNRIKLEYLLKKSKAFDLNHDFYSENSYYDRVEGLFMVCFPNAEKPNDDYFLKNIVGQPCVFKEFGMKLNFKSLSTEEAWAAMNLLTIMFFGSYFVFVFVALVIGMAGVYGVSKPDYSKQKYRCTFILMGIAVAPALIGMGFFHATSFYERNMVSFFCRNLFLSCVNLDRAASEISYLSLSNGLSNGTAMFSSETKHYRAILEINERISCLKS